MSPEALERLMEYNWPGNIRELKSLIQSAVNLAQGRRIEIQHLPEHMRSQTRSSKRSEPAGTAMQPILPLEAVEKAHILYAYNQLDRNKSRTAKSLGIGLNTLRRKLESYGVA